MLAREHVSNSPSPWAYLVGASGALALTAFVGYGLSRPTSYEVRQPGENSRNVPPVQRHPSGEGVTRELVRYRITKMYSYLAASVLTTGVSSYIAYKSGWARFIITAMNTHPILYTALSTISSIGLVYSVLYTKIRDNPKLKHALWFIFNANIGQTLSVLGYISSTLVTKAALLSGFILGGISTASMAAPNENMLKWGSYLGLALGMLMGASWLEIIFPNNRMLRNVNIVGGLGIFGVYTAYDTNRALFRARTVDNLAYDPIDEQMGLFLDLINFFVKMVRLLLEMEENKKKKEEEEEERRQQASQRR